MALTWPVEMTTTEKQATEKQSVRFAKIDDQIASRICEEFCSPVYILDELGIYERFERFQAAAKTNYENSGVAVSYKTNPTRSMLAELHRRGALAEVVSGDEYQIALSLGVRPTKIIFNGPAKSNRDLELAISAGSYVNCDHTDEVDRIETIARQKNTVAKIGLRLYFPGEHSWERFGFLADDNSRCYAMKKVERIVWSPHLQLCGLHSHIGTNVRELEAFHNFASEYAKFADRVRDKFALEMQWIDVGGGLAGIAPLLTECQMHPHELPPINDYCHAVVTPLLPYLNSCASPPKLFFEPGRTLFNAFGGILVSVIGRRPAGDDGIESVILDAGITSLALVHKYNYPVHVCKGFNRNRRNPPNLPLKKGGTPRPMKKRAACAQTKQVRLLGPTCMEWDVVSRPTQLPELFPGDRLLIYGTGCYSMALANSFTHFRLGIVGWSKDNQFRWLRKPETIEHSSRLDVLTESVETDSTATVLNLPRQNRAGSPRQSNASDALTLSNKLTDVGFSKAMDVYCWSRGVRIAPTKTMHDMRQHDWLVQKIFYESGIFDSRETRLVEEPAEAKSECFLVRRKSEPIGAITVIQNPVLLPVQEFFNIQLPEDVERDRIAEITRFVIEREHRKQDPAVSVGLLKAALSYSRQQNIRWWIWCAPSVFLWGFQKYFQRWQILPQLPPDPRQIASRKGRESYFDPARAICVVLVDLQSVNITKSAFEILRRHRRRQRTIQNRIKHKRAA